jgi:hypothetical protein
MATDKQTKNSDARAKRLANLKPFKKGQSGNPAGRPKSITLSEAMRNELAKILPGTEQTFAEIIASKLVKAAALGNVLAAKEIADRTEGRPKQALDVDMNVRDWRAIAAQHGVSNEDVIREAQLLIESASDSGDV